jgi:hypothetical protein
MGRLLLIPIRNVSLFVLLTDMVFAWSAALLVWIFLALPWVLGGALLGSWSVWFLVFWSFGLSLLC